MGEETAPHIRSRSHHTSTINPMLLTKVLASLLVVLVVAGLGFYAGINYQKHHTGSSTATRMASAGSSFGARGSGYGRRRGVYGQVTTISSTSITIQDQTTGSSSTLAITSSTSITDNGQSVSTSDIQTGDTVVIMPSTSNSSQAARILVNPSLGGGEPGQSSTGPGTQNNVMTN